MTAVDFCVGAVCWETAAAVGELDAAAEAAAGSEEAEAEAICVSDAAVEASPGRLVAGTNWPVRTAEPVADGTDAANAMPCEVTAAV